MAGAAPGHRRRPAGPARPRRYPERHRHPGHRQPVLAAAVAVALQLTVQDRRDRPQPYAEATRLLTQLRSVARQLPGATLDPGGLAQHLIDEVRAVARVDRAAVLSAGGGSRLVVIAQ